MTREGVDPPRGDERILSGPVTLYEVATVREIFRAALAAEAPTGIDLSESGPWDIAGLQLLIACVKAGRLRGQEVRFVNVPPGCVDQARRYGLSEWLGSVGG